MHNSETGPRVEDVDSKPKNPIEGMFSIAESTEIFKGRVGRMSESANKKTLLCESISKLGQTYFFGKQAELDQAIAQVEAGEYQTDAELVAAAAQCIYDFSRTQITPKEMESNIRSQFRDERRENLNEVMTYDVSGNVLSIHLEPSYTLNLGEKLSAFQTGFAELAKRLSERQELNGISTIRAVSWIVAKRPGLFTRSGFTYLGEVPEELKTPVDIRDGRPIGVAQIEKDDFIKMHTKT